MSTKTLTAANADLDTRYGSGTAGGFYVAALATCTSGDAEAGTVTELTGGSYARQAISFAAASARAKASNTEIDFGVSDYAHADIGAWGICEDASGPTTWKHVIRLNTPVPFGIGYQPKIASGDLSITEGTYSSP